MFEAPAFSNGAPLPSSSGLDLVGAGRASMGQPVMVNLNIDGKAVGTAVMRDGRIVTEGAISAMKGNAGRRQMAVLQTSPGTILA